MGSLAADYHEKTDANVDAVACQPTCPACGELLTPFAGFARCPRCRFAICRSCDSGSDGEVV